MIVGFRSEAVIESCIASVAGLAGLGSIVLVDHGDGNTAAAARQTGAQVLIDSTNPGFGAGQNRGISLTRAPFLLLLNPDARVVPAGVARGIEVMTNSESVGAIQGVIVDPESQQVDRSQGSELGPLHLWGRALGAGRLAGVPLVSWIGSRSHVLRDHFERRPEFSVEVEWLAATALLIRRTAIAGIGGFDERYFMYGEDLDLCRRLRATGWRLVALPDDWATHVNGGSSSDWWDRELQWWTGTMAFASRWWSGPRWISAVMAASVRAAWLSARRPTRFSTALTSVVLGPIGQHRKPRPSR